MPSLRRLSLPILLLAGGSLLTGAAAVPPGDELYDVDVRVIGRDGAPIDGTQVEVFEQHGGSYQIDPAGTTLRLPAGTYRFSTWGYVETGGPASVSFVTVDDVAVEDATTVTLDARGSVPFRTHVQRPDAVPQRLTLGYAATAGNGEESVSTFTVFEPDEDTEVWAKPTTAAPRTGSFEFDTQAYLRPAATGEASYTYNLATSTPDRVPANLTYRYRDADLARVERTFRGHGAGGRGVTLQTPALRAGGPTPPQEFRHGSRRTDLLSPGLTWETTVEGFVTADDEGYQSPRAPWATSRSYPAGTVRETFGGQLGGAALPLRDLPFLPGLARRGDRIDGALIPWTDAEGHSSLLGVGNDLRWSLTSGGAPVAAGEREEISADLPPRRRDYELTVTGAREVAGGLALSTGVTARWTFRSGTAPADGARLPLLSLDASLPLDIENSAPRGTAMTFGVTGRMPAGLATPRVSSLAVESSAGQKTWTPATVTRTGAAAFTVRVLNPPAAGRVSLRLAAAAGDGAGVRQEVANAYRVR